MVHKKPKVSLSNVKRIGNIARGAHSISREQVKQTHNKSSRQATMEKVTYVSKRDNKNMHDVFVVTLTLQERCDESQNNIYFYFHFIHFILFFT